MQRPQPKQAAAPDKAARLAQDAPWIIGVALAFMKERGCVVPLRGRRHKAASPFVHADAMTEFHGPRDGIGGAA